MKNKKLLLKYLVSAFVLSTQLFMTGCGGGSNLDSILKTQQGKFEYTILKWMVRFNDVKGDGSINGYEASDNLRDLINDSLVLFSERYGKVIEFKCIIDDESDWMAQSLGSIDVKVRKNVHDYGLEPHEFNNYFLEYSLTDTSEIKSDPSDKYSATVSKQAKDGGFDFLKFVRTIKMGDSIQFSGILLRENSLTRKGRFERPEFLIHVTSAKVIAKKD